MWLLQRMHHQVSDIIGKSLISFIHYNDSMPFDKEYLMFQNIELNWWYLPVYDIFSKNKTRSNFRYFDSIPTNIFV